MNKKQIRLIQDSWTVAVTVPNAMGLFYNRLFEIKPEVRSLFPDDLAKQEEKLAYMLGYVVQNLDRLEEITGSIQDLGNSHAKANVKPEYYPPVGEALVWTIQQALGDDYKDEVGEAWGVAYGYLSDKMINAPTKREKRIGNLISKLFGKRKNKAA